MYKTEVMQALYILKEGNKSEYPEIDYDEAVDIACDSLGKNIICRFHLDVKVTSKLSLNAVYAGLHWTKRKRDADYFHTLVSNAAKTAGGTLVNFPVGVEIKYNSKLDVDNHGYMSKMIIDGLKGIVIKDDTKRFVKELTQGFYDGDGIEVTVYEY